MLEGGPYPSEAATWAEIARLEPMDESEHRRGSRARPVLPDRPRATLGVDQC